MLTIANPSYLDATPHPRTMMYWVLPILLLTIAPMMQFTSVSVAIMVGVGIVVKWFLLFADIRVKTWQSSLMLVGMMLWVWHEFGTLIGLEGGSAFLLGLMVLKLFECQTRRDWQVLLLANMFLLVATLFFDQSLLISASIFVCLLLLTMCLALLNDLNRAEAIKSSGLAFILALLPMVVLFVGVPRRETPFLGLPQIKKNQATSGISEQMQPGSISNLVQSNEPVFSATFEQDYQPSQKDLYWRVMIMGFKQGAVWHTMKDFVDNATPNSEQPLSYYLILEDDQGRIPALDYPIQTEHRRGMRYELGDVVRVFNRQGIRKIHLTTSLSSELPHRLTDDEQAWYRRLPDQHNPRTRQLAQQLWQQSGGKVEAFIQAAYSYFHQQGFRYTLQPPLLKGNDRTDKFLFDTKQGFCEHYADAFVMLMRSAGVSARVVTGYQGGEYHEEGHFWQIRSKDAHAWAEVWLPEKQVWKRIDPTSAVAANRIEGNIEQALSGGEASYFASNQWQKYLDQGRFYWQQWIVNYDYERQNNLFHRLGFEKATPLAMILVLILGSMMAVLPIAWWWRRSRAQDIEPLNHGFMQLKRQLLGEDFPQIASLAPNEFRQEWQQHHHALPEDLAQLLDDYITLRYAHPHEPPRAQARAWYQRAKKLAKKYRQNQG